MELHIARACYVSWNIDLKWPSLRHLLIKLFYLKEVRKKKNIQEKSSSQIKFSSAISTAVLNIKREKGVTYLRYSGENLFNQIYLIKLIFQLIKLQTNLCRTMYGTV